MGLLRDVRDADLDRFFEHWADPEANRLGRERWGKGVARRTRPLHAATAYDDVASQRVLEKCGFRRVGAGRGFADARGEEVDETLFRLDA